MQKLGSNCSFCRLEQVLNSFLTNSSDPVALVLDFDGTLVPIQSCPDQVALPQEVKMIIQRLASRCNRRIVIISGRTEGFLEKQFADLAVDLAAEHGGRFRQHETGQWTSLNRELLFWMPEVRALLLNFTKQYFASFIEDKQFCIAWHYREVPSITETEARTIADTLAVKLKHLPVNIIHGKKVIEVRASCVNKNAFILWYVGHILGGKKCHKLIAIGDDVTDEDMFMAVNELGGLTIKVGLEPSCAQHRLTDDAEVRKLLGVMSEQVSFRHYHTIDMDCLVYVLLHLFCFCFYRNLYGSSYEMFLLRHAYFGF